MTDLSLFQVDAFADKPFEGNPAAVVPLDVWLPDEMLLAIAAENNLGATAFFVASEKGYDLRWFTPAVEIPLCGHATLASAHVLFQHLGYEAAEIKFQTKSGELTVGRDGDLYVMDFPSNPAKPTMTSDALCDALGARPSMVLKAKNFLCVFEDLRDVAALQPNIARLTKFCLDANAGVIATAPGNEQMGWDCASRYFAPNFGIAEDPVTGSAHTTIVPFWAKRLDKVDVTARQISKRGGTLFCTMQEDRILMRGRTADYLKGTISV